MLYLVKYVRVSWTEKVRQSFLNSFDHLRPHRFYKEVIAWHCVRPVTDHKDNNSALALSISCSNYVALGYNSYLDMAPPVTSRSSLQ